MRSSKYVDNVIDIILTSFFAIGTYWLTGKFDIFPKINNLIFMNILISVNILKIINYIFLGILIMCFYKECSLFMSICIGLSPYMFSILLKVFSSSMIYRYIVCMILILFIVIYIILAIIFSEVIHIKLFIKKLLTVILFISYITSAIYLCIPIINASHIELTQEFCLDNYRDVFIKFKENHWKILSTEKKEKALKELAVMNLLDLLGEDDQVLEVEIKDINSSTLMGYYQYSDDKIVINDDIIFNRDKIVSVLLHEVYHRYQHKVVEELDDKVNLNIKLLEDVKTWKKEINQYITANENYYEYYNQNIEKTAREYSEEYSVIYIEYIDNLKEVNNGKKNS